MGKMRRPICPECVADFKPKRAADLTGIRKAIRIALGPSSNNGGDLPRVSKDDLYRNSAGVSMRSSIKIDLLFEELSENERAEFLDILSFDHEKPENSKASIHYEWSWSEKETRWHQRRRGGEREDSDAGVPDDILHSIQTTFLGALRDAGSSLSPGRQNRLARLLNVAANENEKEEIEKIFGVANRELQKNPLIFRTEKTISSALVQAVGSHLAQSTVIRS